MSVRDGLLLPEALMVRKMVLVRTSLRLIQLLYLKL
jgi:hypothetical protein